MLRSPLIDTLALFDSNVCDITRWTVKQNVNLLKGQTLGLWQAEVDEWYRERGHAGEDKVRSVPRNESALLQR